MIQKFANMIVDHRKSVLACLTLLTILCAVLFFQVPINTDMTKYLPDDSMMKMGIDKMEEEFPDTDIAKTVRVMFSDLTESEKSEILAQLEAIPNVDEVAYDAESTDYNKDNHTLYIVSTSFDYGSPEEKAIESTIKDQFSSYTMELKNDEANSNPLTIGLVLFALALLFAILFLMCYSWTEPFLFIVTIGFAVIINMGSNIFLGSISNVTASVAAILQLVLSMDYSIILMNRYRQELDNHDTREGAMKTAIANAFSSVTSSSLTTFIGLLMLVFMSFKIGFDLGIVLAKGVVISLFCVLTVLPGLILATHNLIVKTEKPALHLNMYGFAAFSHKCKYIIAVAFVFLFVGAYFAQQNTQIYYALETPDPIADVFPTKNSIVMLYENDDESKVADIVTELENHSKTKEVLGYSTTLGKSYNTAELTDLLDDMDTDMTLEPELLQMLYYDYYTEDAQLSMIPAGQFLNFIANNVATNPTFAEHMDAQMLSQVEDMKKFANAGTLTKQMSIAELAKFLEMNANDVKQLLLYYYTQHGGAATGSMTLPDFVAFVNDDILSDDTYADMIADTTEGSSITEQMQTLQTFTDVEAMTTPIPADQMAALLGMDAAQMQTLYSYYQMSQSGAVMPDANPTQTINPAMYGNMDPALLGGMDPAMLGGMDPSMIDPSMYANMTPEQLAMLQASMGAQQNQTAPSAQPAEPVLVSVQDMMHFLLESEQVSTMLDAETVAQLSTAQRLIDASVEGNAYTAQDMAALLGMDSKSAEQLYLVHISEYGDTSAWMMSVQQLVNFILTDVLNDQAFADQFDAGQKKDLRTAKTLIDAAVSGKAHTPQSMTQLMQSLDNSESFNENTISLLYLYRDSLNDSEERTMTLETLASFLANHIVDDPKYSEMIDDTMRTDIQTMYDELQEERKQLVGDNFTLMMIDTTLDNESAETNDFIAKLIARCEETLSGEYYLIGNSVMNYEMEQSFDQELLTITILTALSVFLVVALTFRSIAIPAILVAIVQCGVYVTVTANGLLGYSIYYLALLIVQCILMGATIDYAILYTTYYQEFRREHSIFKSLVGAYNGSIHTILTSGLIITIVTGVLGFMSADPTIAQICRVISIGAASAITLILLALPSLLAVFDKYVVKKNK